MPLPRQFFIPADVRTNALDYYSPANAALIEQRRSSEQIVSDLRQLREQQNRLVEAMWQERQRREEERKGKMGRDLTMVVVTAALAVVGTTLGGLLVSYFNKPKKPKGKS